VIYESPVLGLFIFWTIWENEQKHQVLDEYHWVNNTGLLSVEEIQAIARERRRNEYKIIFHQDSRKASAT